MSTTLPDITYTARDFTSIIDFLKGVVNSEKPEFWSDFFESNIGIAIMRSVAAQGTVLSFTANQIGREMFLVTCQRLASGLKFARQVGYDVRGRTAASVDLEAKTPFPTALASQALTFNAGTATKIGDLDFELESAITFPIGTTATAATGNIAFSANTIDGDYIIINDGLTVVFFEFDDGSGVAAGHTAVTIAGTDTLTNANLIDAINLSVLNITASVGAATSTDLTHDVVGTVGNHYLLKLNRIALGGQPTDTDTITVNDGVDTVIFEFDDGSGVTPGNIAVTIGATTSDTMTNLITEINAAAPLDITASPVAGSDATNLVNTTIGNSVVLSESCVQATLYGEFNTLTGLTGGANALSLTVTNSQVQDDAFTSNGNAWQIVTTDEGEVSDGSWVVTVGVDLWTEVDSLLLVGALKNYETFLNEEGKLEVKFGDGENGAIPPNGNSITVDYRTGGGLSGNVLAHAANGAVLVGYFGVTAVNVIFDNFSAGSGGTDAETLAELQLNIPPYMRSMDKAVTWEDYEVLARSFECSQGAISRAVAELRDPTPPPPVLYTANIIDIYAWSRSALTYAAPSTALKNALFDYLHAKRCACAVVVVNDGLTQPIGIDMATIVISTQFTIAQATVLINTAIVDFFLAFQPGDTFYTSQFYEALVSLDVVQYFTIHTINGAPPPVSGEITSLSNELNVIGGMVFTPAYPA